MTRRGRIVGIPDCRLPDMKPALARAFAPKVDRSEIPLVVDGVDLRPVLLEALRSLAMHRANGTRRHDTASQLRLTCAARALGLIPR